MHRKRLLFNSAGVCSGAEEKHSGWNQSISVTDNTINNELFSSESIMTNWMLKMLELPSSVAVELTAALN